MNGSNIGARLCETVRTASSHPDEPSESGVWSGEVEPLNVLPHIPWVHVIHRLADAHTVSWTAILINAERLLQYFGAVSML